MESLPTNQHNNFHSVSNVTINKKQKKKQKNNSFVWFGDKKDQVGSV